MKRDLPPERSSLLSPADLSGLAPQDVPELRARFGPNLLAEQPPKVLADLAKDTLTDPMLWFLAVTGLVFLLLGETTDAVILLLAVIPLVGMDFYLHRRTEASIKSLRSVLASEARVIRQGSELLIAATELVAGDLVKVKTGEVFPADGIVLSGRELQADESALTGEAFPVAKHPLAATSDAADPADSNWAYAGTRLLTGEALLRVLYTGQESLYGEIVRIAGTSRHERSPLQQEVLWLVRLLVIVAIGLCLVLAAVRLWQGYGWLDAFISAAVLAVAAIPEEFPVVLTFFLALGVYRLAQRKALVRNPAAVENIGRVEVICTDKTGTITEGKLVLQHIRPAAPWDEGIVLACARRASRKNTGDPLDEALLATAGPPMPDGPIATFPFTEARRREVSIWQEDGQLEAFAKGAPETILAMCTLTESERGQALADLSELALAGQKVIACARRRADPSLLEPEGDFTFVGLIGIGDPVRKEARAAIAAVRGAGIQVIMVTGDHPQTALAVARDAGIAAEPLALTGDELEARLVSGDRDFLRDIAVVARASPAQKIALVTAIRATGRITAVSGDGVNDVPALKAADIGIAMGLTGTRSAREVASVILLDDNFHTISMAIAEGRQLFANLVRSFAYLLMVHIPLVTTATLVPLLGYPLLFLPVHIVMLELLIHPAAILGFQRKPEGRILRARHGRRAFFGTAATLALLATGAAIAAAVFGLFVAGMRAGPSEELARSVAITGLVAAMICLFALLAGLREKAPLIITASSTAFLLAAMTFPPVSAVLHLQPLDPQVLLGASAVGALSAMPVLLFQAAQRPGGKAG